MAERRHRPIGPVLRLLPFVGALAAGVLAYVVAARDPRRVVSIPFRSPALAEEERHWVDAVLPPRFLPAPMPPSPCGYIDSDWSDELVEAHQYIREGRTEDAGVVLSRYFSAPSGVNLQNDVSAAVHSASTSFTSPSTTDVLGAVHLLQTWAYVLLKDNATGPTLWRALKHPIGYTDLLSRRGVVGPLRGEYTWSRITIRWPGCDSTREDLTTYHLYNNLILGYLKNPEYRDSGDRREREFARTYDDPPDVNPLLAVLEKRRKEPPEGREGWRWAISNSERLIRKLTLHQNRDSLQAPPWLAANLAQILDSARIETDPPVVGPLLNQRDAMITAAEHGELDVAPEQRQDLALALARLQLLRAIDGEGPPRVSPWIDLHLDSTQRSVVQAVSHATRWRRDPDVLVAALANRAPTDSLAVQDPDAWSAAARHDLSRHFARIGAAAASRERGAWVRRARGMLAAGDPVPPELRELEADKDVVRLLQQYPPLAFGVGLVASFPFLAYLAWLLGRREALWVSYYRIEAGERVRQQR